jgi:hypothetical protein
MLDSNTLRKAMNEKAQKKAPPKWCLLTTADEAA